MGERGGSWGGEGALGDHVEQLEVVVGPLLLLGLLLRPGELGLRLLLLFRFLLVLRPLLRRHRCRPPAARPQAHPAQGLVCGAGWVVARPRYGCGCALPRCPASYSQLHWTSSGGCVVVPVGRRCHVVVWLPPCRDRAFTACWEGCDSHQSLQALYHWHHSPPQRSPQSLGPRFPRPLWPALATGYQQRERTNGRCRPAGNTINSSQRIFSVHTAVLTSFVWCVHSGVRGRTPP